MNAPMCGEPFSDLRVVTLKDDPLITKNGISARKLHEVFPKIPQHGLFLLCAELVSRGLLKDEGIGRLDVRSMEYFVITDLAEWFISWIVD
jgi:hypothetical protein